MLLLLISIATTQLVALASPGPDFFFISQVAASSTRKQTFKAVCGITLGVFIWALLAILGLNILLKQLPMLHRGIMILGGGYLLYLAYLLTKSALSAHKAKNNDESPEPKTPTVHSKFFLKGLLTNLSNTKALIYFVSVFSAIVTGSVDIGTKGIILGLITFETFAWFLLIAYIFSLPSIKAKYQQYTQFVDGAAGLCFGFFGCWLVYSGAVGHLSI